jgi:hypothetical protein|tara:strand:- start:1327 stop:1707 length:381 start_codon:yes stop_codon:yes gene_type:complete
MVNINMQNKYQEKFPFITGLKYGETEHFGIVVNYDNSIITFYDISKIKNLGDTKILLELGDTWWWESNRMMPIDVFLHHEMKSFRPYLTTFIMKDVTHMFGPMTTLQNLLKKRIKRRGIQLIRKSD